MNVLKRGNQRHLGALAVMLLGLWMALGSVAAAPEESFDQLQIGTRTYKNVTITTKGKNYIMLLHSEGIASVRVAELTPELRQQLGYEAPKPKGVSNNVNTWAKQAVAKVDSPEVKAIQQEILTRQWPGVGVIGTSAPNLWRFLAIVLGIGFVCYLFSCYCYARICRRAGADPGALVWVPVLQVVPLLRAAGMSGWWLLGFMIPGLNLLGHILWSMKITKACGKGGGTTLLLVVPITTWIGVLYLAFSSSPSPKRKFGAPKIELMSLETA